MKNKVLRSATKVLGKKLILVIVLTVAIALSMALQLIPAFILRKIIDENFAQGLLSGIWRLAFIYLLVTSGANIVEFVKITITTLLGQSILKEIRFEMSVRLSKLPINYFVSTPTGDTMSRLTTDVDAVNSLFSAGIINVITDLFKIGGLLISLYILAPAILWLEVVVVLAVFLLANYFRKNILKFQKQVRVKISAIYTFIQEWISGIRTVKAYSAEETGKNKFQELLSSLISSINGISSYDSWFPCVMQTLRAGIIATALWFCADNGTILSLGLSVGTLAAVTDLIGKLFYPIEALATEFQTIQQSMAGIERINDFFAQPVEARIYSDELPTQAGIELESLSFAYGEFSVLENISLKIKKGEKAVLVGRSGAGKTTLMNLAAGLYAPASGKITICGINPFTLPPYNRRKLIGIVPQMPQIFDGTIAENITLRDPEITEEQIVEAAKVVGLHETIMAMPIGYRTVIGEGEAGLSGGEVQLLSIARAIVSNPQILLLDEPTSGMDAQTEQRIFAAIRATSEGRTILSISHRLSGIIDADTIHIIAKKGVVESGSPDELVQKDGWYAMYSRIDKAGWEVSYGI